MTKLNELTHEAGVLAGREIGVEQTTDGQYIAIYMRLDRPPPRKGATPEEALLFFIEDIRAYQATDQGKAEAAVEAQG